MRIRYLSGVASWLSIRENVGKPLLSSLLHLGLLVLAMLYAAGLGLVQALTLTVLICFCSRGASRFAVKLGLEKSLISGFVLFLCGVIPFATFVVVLAGGIHSPVSIAVVIFALMLCGLGVVSRSGGVSKQNEGPWFSFLALVVVVSLVTKMWYFMVPVTVGIGIFALSQLLKNSLLNKRVTLMLQGAGIALILSGAVWAQNLSWHSWSEGSIFRTTDQYFRASLGVGVISFGVDENMGAASHPIRYHWLSEGFVNLLGRIGFLSPIDAVVRMSPILAALAAAAATYLLIVTAGGRRVQGVFGSLMISAFSVLLYSQGINILKTTEMGQFWGTPLFLFGVLLLYLMVEMDRGIAALIMVIWFPLLVMTNTTLGLAFACGTGVILVVSSIRGRVSYWCSALVLVGMFLTLQILRMTLLASTSLEAFTPQFRLDDPFGFAFAFGYDGQVGAEKAIVGLALLAVLWFQGGAALWIRIKGPSQRPRLFISLFTIGAIPPAFFFSILEGSDQYRFLKPILILGPVSLALAFDEMINVAKVMRGALLAACVILSVWLGRQVDILGKAFGDFEAMKPRVELSVLLIAIPLVVFISVFLAGKVKRFEALRSVRLVGIFGTFSLLVSMTAQLHLGPGQYSYATSLIGPSISNQKRIECLDFVRSATSRDSVVASYMWRFGADSMTEKWFLVSAVTQRRAFVDGPIYVENPQSDWIKLRQDITTRFVEVAPNYADRAVMLKAGVEYFVVDTRWTRRQSWQPYAERVYSNSDCIVLRLTKSNV